jgi:ADP-heptose:LPS heptosyltransferase
LGERRKKRKNAARSDLPRGSLATKLILQMSGCYVAFHKQLGDLVLLEPALARLRAHHGEPVRLLTRGGHAPLAALMPGVVFNRGPAVRPASFLYCYDHVGKSAFRSLLAPVGKKLFLPPEEREVRWFHRLIFSRVPAPELGGRYVAEFFWSHTPVPTAQSFRPPVLNPPPSEWAPPGKKPQSYVLINPTSGWRKKLWLPEAWISLLRTLGDLGPFIMTSGGQDWQNDHCARIAAGSPMEDFFTATSLKEYLWLCANARAVITVDGAASHLAAAFGVPGLTLFGPTSMDNWYFPSPRQIALQAPAGEDGVCRLKLLDPVLVADTARSLLSPARVV